MIGYVTLGTNDLARAHAFYAPLFEILHLAPYYQDETVVTWGDLDDETVPRFYVCLPYDDAPATVGNGTMTALRVPAASGVDDLYALALKNGGSDEGVPGFRPELYGERFYVGYVRDPDGNKLAFVCYDGKSNP